jgi:glycosyltransferase involved in cell wall biosynthesis
VASAADIVWTHAQRSVADIAALGVPTDRVVVAYRGVDLRLFSEPNAVKVPGRIVAAGRLVRDKHVDDVLAAFQLVRARYPQATLLVLGQGPDRARLERLARTLGIADAVSFAGHVPQSRVRDELRRAQAFITMSREDGDRLANVVKEAMASWCVPVVSLTPGIDELVADQVTGFIVPQGDANAAAGRLMELFANPVRAHRMGGLGARHIHAQFNVRHTMTEYLTQWTRLVNDETLVTPAVCPVPAAQYR